MSREFKNPPEVRAALATARRRQRNEKSYCMKCLKRSNPPESLGGPCVFSRRWLTIGYCRQEAQTVGNNLSSNEGKQ